MLVVQNTCVQAYVFCPLIKQLSIWATTGTYDHLKLMRHFCFVFLFQCVSPRARARASRWERGWKKSCFAFYYYYFCYIYQRYSCLLQPSSWIPTMKKQARSGKDASWLYDCVHWILRETCVKCRRTDRQIPKGTIKRGCPNILDLISDLQINRRMDGWKDFLIEMRECI